MGPAAYRTAGLSQVSAELGWTITYLGDAAPTEEPILDHANHAVKNLEALAGWTHSLSGKALEMARGCDLPVFLAAITQCRPAPYWA